MLFRSLLRYAIYYFFPQATALIFFQHMMLYYFKKGKNATETQEKICAVYGEGAVTDQMHQKWFVGTSLVAQWLRIHLPMQGTQVQALVREDPTCCGATKPVHHNY